MASGDPNAILRAYLAAEAGLVAVVGTRIYVPRLPEGCALPALGLFVRGGWSTPYIPEITDPSFQIDCWGATQIEARQVYTALYDCLQGVQDETVTVGGTDYRILGAMEEVQGQDLQDVEYPGYCRVLTFFRITMQI